MKTKEKSAASAWGLTEAEFAARVEQNRKKNKPARRFKTKLGIGKSLVLAGKKVTRTTLQKFECGGEVFHRAELAKFLGVKEETI